MVACSFLQLLRQSLYPPQSIGTPRLAEEMVVAYINPRLLSLGMRVLS